MKHANAALQNLVASVVKVTLIRALWLGDVWSMQPGDWHPR